MRYAYIFQIRVYKLREWINRKKNDYTCIRGNRISVYKRWILGEEGPDGADRMRWDRSTGF